MPKYVEIQNKNFFRIFESIFINFIILYYFYFCLLKFNYKMGKSYCCLNINIYYKRVKKNQLQ